MDALDAWLKQGVRPETAGAVFDHLPAISVEALQGTWDGAGLPSGHPLDGLLEYHGWQGKRFRDPDTVDPLLFRHGSGTLSVAAARIPYSLILRPPRLARAAAARQAVAALLPLLSTHRPGARLRLAQWGSKVSAAMIYDGLPIIDHFRWVDQNRVMGLMDYRDMPAPFFFLLTRAPEIRDAG